MIYKEEKTVKFNLQVKPFLLQAIDEKPVGTKKEIEEVSSLFEKLENDEDVILSNYKAFILDWAMKKAPLKNRGKLDLINYLETNL